MSHTKGGDDMAINLAAPKVDSKTVAVATNVIKKLSAKRKDAKNVSK